MSDYPFQGKGEPCPECGRPTRKRRLETAIEIAGHDEDFYVGVRDVPGFECFRCELTYYGEAGEDVIARAVADHMRSCTLCKALGFDAEKYLAGDAAAKARAEP